MRRVETTLFDSNINTYRNSERVRQKNLSLMVSRSKNLNLTLSATLSKRRSIDLASLQNEGGPLYRCCCKLGYDCRVFPGKFIKRLYTCILYLVLSIEMADNAQYSCKSERTKLRTGLSTTSSTIYLLATLALQIQDAVSKDKQF